MKGLVDCCRGVELVIYRVPFCTLFYKWIDVVVGLWEMENGIVVSTYVLFYIKSIHTFSMTLL